MPPRKRAVHLVAETEVAESAVTFLSSGSRLLDLCLGGGYPLGRVINIVGDRSSGKTLLAIEACANFARLYDAPRIRYAEAEAAFDEEYARTLGFPRGASLFAAVDADCMTVEALFRDLQSFLDSLSGNQPSLYVIDSLDALTDDAEMKRDIDEGSYGASKAKKISELFRRLISDIAKKRCLLIVVSQIRDKINVSFGETKTRSGGRALDFYASQIIWLIEIGKLKRQSLSVERVVGVSVIARTKKNKVGLPFRDVELSIMFGYGIDDEESMLNWLNKAKAIDLLYAKPAEIRKDLQAARSVGDREALAFISDNIYEVVAGRWNEVEEKLRPGLAKYP